MRDVSGGVEPRPYAPPTEGAYLRRREVTPPYERLPMARTLYVRADVGIRPYARSFDGHSVGGDALIAPPRPQARKSLPPSAREVAKPQVLTEGETQYALSPSRLRRQPPPRGGQEYEHRPPTTVYRRQKRFFNRRQKAATYLCRFAAKARFDNRPYPQRVYPKREGRSPPSLVVSRSGDF